MPEKQDLQPILDAQKGQLEMIISEGTSIDNRALAILASNVAIVIFASQAMPATLPFWQLCLLYGPFLCSLLLDILSIWPRPYKGPGINEDKLPYYLMLNRDDLFLKLLSNANAAIKHNSAHNRVRQRFCLWSIGLTGLGFVALLFIL